jgi:nucleotide-binding universal stress UspA family protein
MKISILGIGDFQTRQLRENVALALAAYPVNSEVVDVTEVSAIVASGVSRTPALLFDSVIVAEGEVPTPADIMTLFKRRYMYQSKLYQLKKILVPIDFSNLSDGAMRYAYKLAQVLDADMEIVHFHEPDNPLLQPHLSIDFVYNLTKKLYNHVENTLQITLQNDGTAQKVTTRLIREAPKFSLVELSKESDIIVISTAGTNGWPEPFFDNVSAYVAREAHCPVLLVPSHAIFKGLPNIVYAANFESKLSEKVKEVVSFAEKFDSQLHFVHIGKMELSDKTLEEQIFEINFRYAGGKYPFRFDRIVSDNIVESLTEFSKLQNADLIVFITEHRDFWQDLLHSSVSREMLFSTKIPILVAHVMDYRLEST